MIHSFHQFTLQTLGVLELIYTKKTSESGGNATRHLLMKDGMLDGSSSVLL